MSESPTGLTAEDHEIFGEMRDWVRSLVAPEYREQFDDDPEFKIAVLNCFFQSVAWPTDDLWTLHALGLVFGDALAASTGTQWGIDIIEGDRVPVLTLADADLSVNAFVAFRKRVQLKEEFDVVDLFFAFCRDIEKAKAFLAENP